MFKNRELKVTMEKKNQTPIENDIPRTPFNVKAAIVAHHVDQTVKKVALGVAGYIILDTVRKVMVEVAKSTNK